MQVVKQLIEILTKYLFKLIVFLLKLGPIPKHVGFIMDGNRRFAKRLKMESYKGHSFGFKQLENTLEWCMAMGIKVVSIYAFSIENFKRTQKEIDVLMDLAEEKFEEFLKQDAFINRNGICVRVIGDLSLLRPTTRKAAEKLMWHTRNGTNAILNIACPYTSTEEMNSAINGVKVGLEAGKLEKNDVTEYLLDDCMYTQDTYPLDVMVRTSGEVRLSDFMLWQVVYV